MRELKNVKLTFLTDARCSSKYQSAKTAKYEFFLFSDGIWNLPGFHGSSCGGAVRYGAVDGNQQ
jgi:hypothetical protein